MDDLKIFVKNKPDTGTNFGIEKFTMFEIFNEIRSNRLNEIRQPPKLSGISIWMNLIKVKDYQK